MRSPSPRANIAPFLAMEMARAADRRAAAGKRVARFDVGQPFAGAPPQAFAAAERAYADVALGYTEGLGLPALRRKLSEFYARKHGLDISPDRIAITTGASGAFLLTFLALFDTGDRVALAAPGYPPYRHILTALGMKPAIAPAQAADRYQLAPHHLDDLARIAPLAGALVASPANPTGSVLPRQALSALAAKARALGAALISDEIYHGLVYDTEATTALAIDNDAFVINSFSKYWAMTGWRVGWIVAPERYIGAIERLSQNLFVAPPTPGQIAAIAALDADEECERLRGIYANNRRLLLDALPKLNLPIVSPPDGAFYVLVDVTAHAKDSADFCKRALEDADVALTMGTDFDDARGAHWARIAYARHTDEISYGLERLRTWLQVVRV